MKNDIQRKQQHYLLTLKDEQGTDGGKVELKKVSEASKYLAALRCAV